MRRFLSALLITIAALPAAGENRLDNFAEDLRRDFDRFAEDNRQSYNRFWQGLDSAYAVFMANPWQPVKLTRPQPPTPVPRPKPQPVIVTDTAIRPVIKIHTVIPAPTPRPQPQPVVPIHDDGDNGRRSKVYDHTFRFYGTPATVSCPESLSSVRIKADSPNPYGEALLQFGEQDFDLMVNDLIDLRSSLDLCDWAYKGMLSQLAESMMGAGGNESQLLYGLLMARSGYRVRFGRYTTPTDTSERLCVLFAADGSCIDVHSAMTGAGRFYAERSIPADAEMEICEFAMPGEKAIDLAITRLPQIAVKHTPQRVVPVRYIEKADTLRVRSNKNMIDFLDSYPKVVTRGWLTAWSTCGNIPFSDDLRSQLYPQLKESIKDMDEVEAAEYLLHVAQSFPYAYDDEVWGGDYPLAAEQTWYHRGSDCEDHAIHFSRLVRDLLGLETALAYVPGHLVACIIFKHHTVEGQTIECEGKSYLVCDPTYYGASLGKTFIKYDDTNSYLIKL